jgi:capsular polysaccharide biosynthesis protein
MPKTLLRRRRNNVADAHRLCEFRASSVLELVPVPAAVTACRPTRRAAGDVLAAMHLPGERSIRIAFRRRAPRLAELARRAGWTPGRAALPFLDDLDALLESRPRRVALLAAPETSPLAEPLRRHPHVAELEVFDPERKDLHAAMTAAGPFGVVVDDTPPRTGHAALVRRTFGHVRKGGAYLVRHAYSSRGNDIAEMVGALATGRLSRPPRRREPASPDRRMAATVGRVTVRGRYAVLTCRVDVRVKVHESEVNDLLDRRGPELGSVLRTVPGETLHSRATINQSPSDHAAPVADAYHSPDLYVRQYRDVVCAPGQVAYRGNVILPDSFRHNMRPWLNNHKIRQAGPGFAVTPEARPQEHLPGAYFYLDNEIRGHYGHAMTEQLSKLWAWREAKAADPGLKALMLERRPLQDFEAVLYAAGGIDPTDLVMPDHPVRVERLVAPTPMFSQPEYVHPDLPALWDEVSTNLAVQAPDRDYPRRFFCSRRPRKRDCTNGAEVEALFAAHGFAVVYPEDYPLVEQARMFREADVIAGYAGSAMISTVMCGAPKHVILVASESYHAKNEHLIAAAAGHRLDIAWCRAERQRVPGVGFSRAVFHSAFTFDHDREGAWLGQVLAGL